MTMFDKLSAIDEHYNALERLLGDPAVISDYGRVAEYSKERSGLTEIVETYRDYLRRQNELEGARELANTETDAELQAMAQEEADQLAASLIELEDRLRLLLLPKDARDDKNVIMEIRAGTGGDEAGLFVADLFRMYSYYATQRGWKIEVVNANENGIGGYKEIVFEVQGEGAYSRLKDDGGRKAHPTQKPEALLHRVLLATTNPGDTVLDPFFGTGTTGVVAEKLGRKWIGIERDKDYAKAAEERIAKVKPLSASAVEPIASKRAEPRVPFGTLIELGILRAGAKLYDERRSVLAEVKADGTLAVPTGRGSIHRMGAAVQGKSACNGWTFWHYDEGGKLKPIDALRDRAKVALGLTKAAPASPLIAAE